MKINITGIGMDGKNTLTSEAFKAIENSDLLIGAGRMLAPFEYLDTEKYESYDPVKISEYIHSSGCENISVLMSGDCGFFSGTKKLLKYLQNDDVEVYPGISTPVYLCSKTGYEWEDMKFVSLHGKSSNIAVNVLENRLCFFLLGGDITVAELCRRLCRYGLSDVKVTAGEMLASEDEKITAGTAGELCSLVTEKLCAVITENPAALRYIPSGIDDGEFIRSSIPMTKSEVRSLVVSSLDICSDDVCWDIGCGTGSVSVEMALRCCDGTVYAFDRKEEAAELTLENSRRFGCDNIKAYGMKFPPEDDSDLPVPDKVFIGGSGGNLRKIVELVRIKNPSAKIVVTAVSLETLEEARDVLGECSVIQIAVTRTEKTGNSTMMRAQNPVFIIKML